MPSLVKLFQTVPHQVHGGTLDCSAGSPTPKRRVFGHVDNTEPREALTLTVESVLPLLYIVKSIAGAMMPYRGVKEFPAGMTGFSYT